MAGLRSIKEFLQAIFMSETLLCNRLLFSKPKKKDFLDSSNKILQCLPQL